jgi:hypothetical protein
VVNSHNPQKIRSYPQDIHMQYHKLIVIHQADEDNIRVRIRSPHADMRQLLECGLCRRLLAAGFRIDLATDPAPAGSRVRGEFRVED